MNYENVLCETDGELLLVTLHRPERHNAMTHQMRVDLLDCARRAEADDAIHAIVFTGYGNKSFCAGANIADLQGRCQVELPSHHPDQDSQEPKTLPHGLPRQIRIPPPTDRRSGERGHD